MRDRIPNRAVCIVSGTTFHAVRTVLKQEMRYSDNGYSSGYSFSLIADRSSLTAIPADNTEITVDGTVYLVALTEQDPVAATMTIHCAERTA